MIAASGVSAILTIRQPELHNAVALVEVGRVWGKPLKDIYVTVEIANSQGFIQEVAAKAGVKPGQLARSVQVAAVESGVPHSLYARPLVVPRGATLTIRNDTADVGCAERTVRRVLEHLKRRLRDLEANPPERPASPSA